MKKLFFQLLLIAAGDFQLHAQNVGIGTTTPTRGKLEVVGVAGTGSTAAIFSSGGTGVSIQPFWPTIGFNQYRDNPSGNGKHIADGYAAIQYFDPNNGVMVFDAFNNGTANAFHRVIYWKHSHFHIGHVHWYHCNTKYSFIKFLCPVNVSYWYFKPADCIFHV